MIDGNVTEKGITRLSPRLFEGEPPLACQRSNIDPGADKGASITPGSFPDKEFVGIRLCPPELMIQVSDYKLQIEAGEMRKNVKERRRVRSPRKCHYQSASRHAECVFSDEARNLFTQKLHSLDP
jgi:hypothetical protein